MSLFDRLELPRDYDPIQNDFVVLFATLAESLAMLDEVPPQIRGASMVLDQLDVGIEDIAAVANRPDYLRHLAREFRREVEMASDSS